MDVLVVGGTGLLGSAVVERTGGVPASPTTGFDLFADDPASLVDAREFDAVVFAANVERADVPIPEYDEAVQSFVDACAGARLVYVSSDAVFDGAAGRYEPADARSPKDDYGRRLQLFEDRLRAHDDAVVLRPSYVYAASPPSPRLAAARDALADGTYERFDDVYRSPAHVDDVAAAVCELAAGDWTGVFHVPGPRLSVYEFHQRALDALGVDTDGLRPTEAPASMDVAMDRSLAGPRFDDELSTEIRPPADAL
ncbi:sugar nucleotide-binding protein [Halobacterium wangiae]|uniref:sugar nucleotide-binding protein n=1 Tax=Halobacterium wangiae TaxID=2902623 RepID=UPI001E3EDD8A|nr:sugar nucleotide-binding protein [Halobacterium wangiae]